MKLLPKGKCINLPLADQKGKGIDLITVAFNNDLLIARQQQFLNRFVKDEFMHIIVDNSTDRSCSCRLQQFCKKESLAYLRIPFNPLGRIGSSYSHAAAVNYVYCKVVRKRNPKAFGIIDHDLFPVREVHICDYLNEQPFYGPLRKRQEGKYWYLSGIMSFFNTEWVKQHGGIDYMPVMPESAYLDTGGGNWFRFFSEVDRTQYKFPSEEKVPLRDGGDRHGDFLEYFDDKHWLHTINGSCWKAVAEGKDNQVQTILDKILNE